MKNCAVVCEYNPFHTGHGYQLRQARESGVGSIVCVMSGAFVQSAMPAFCDKALRAKCAVVGGADAVIELPTVYCTASAQLFAEGAVKIIKEIKNIGYMAMGATAEPDSICKIAEFKIKHNAKIADKLKTLMQFGKSYNAASMTALTELYGNAYPADGDIGNILVEPNNMLCVEYIAAADKLCADVEPLIIKRVGATHNDADRSGKYISATAIRNAERDGNFASVLDRIPHFADEIAEWRNAHSPDMSAFKALIVFALKCAEPYAIAQARDCSEGLEYLLKNVSKTYDYDGIVDAVSGKRYTKKRIARLLLDILLSIDKSMTQKRFCTRLLACKNGFDFGILPDLVKTDNASIKAAANADDEVRDVLNVDIRATALYNTVCRTDGDYFNYSIVKI